MAAINIKSEPEWDMLSNIPNDVPKDTAGAYVPCGQSTYSADWNALLEACFPADAPCMSNGNHQSPIVTSFAGQRQDQIVEIEQALAKANYECKELELQVAQSATKVRALEDMLVRLRDDHQIDTEEIDAAVPNVETPNVRPLSNNVDMREDYPPPIAYPSQQQKGYVKMAPQVLHRVIYGTTTPTALQKSYLTIRPAVLQGYSRHKVRGCDYPAILPSHTPSTTLEESPSVRGTLVTGLSAANVYRLDIFEGDEYKRRKVSVELISPSSADGSGDFRGKAMEVETYVWVDDPKRLEEGEWDFETFVREKLGRWVGHKEYLEVDEAVRGMEGGVDPTGGRAMRATEREVVRSAV
ncbi:hypothetical protein MMC11_005016 [Xylographa trunciseda]|nr:hypothetical protein [Xylographa trunciseda]